MELFVAFQVNSKDFIIETQLQTKFQKVEATFAKI
jgi:hypothetical protein